MIKRTLVTITVIFLISCSKDQVDTTAKEQNGNVWLSGGLYVCAQQIHLDNGDTLITSLEDVMPYRSGDRVNVKYREVGRNESCPTGIDGEIVSIKKIE